MSKVEKSSPFEGWIETLEQVLYCGKDEWNKAVLKLSTGLSEDDSLASFVFAPRNKNIAYP